MTLAEAEFFRIRWSIEVLAETQAAIKKIRLGKGHRDAGAKAAKSRLQMEAAFEEAVVADFDDFLPMCKGLPDPKDAHVLAAALKTQAATIVTENLKDFPESILRPLNVEAKSGDAFIADTIELGSGSAVAAIKRMRVRLKAPETTAEALLLQMEARGLTETVDVLKPFIKLL